MRIAVIPGDGIGVEVTAAARVVPRPGLPEAPEPDRRDEGLLNIVE